MNDKYLILTEAKSIREQFSTEKEFEDWLRIDFEGSHYEDLLFALQVFEEAEMYEDCIIIKKILDEF